MRRQTVNEESARKKNYASVGRLWVFSGSPFYPEALPFCCDVTDVPATATRACTRRSPQHAYSRRRYGCYDDCHHCVLGAPLLGRRRAPQRSLRGVGILRERVRVLSRRLREPRGPARRAGRPDGGVQGEEGQGSQLTQGHAREGGDHARCGFPLRGPPGASPFRPVPSPAFLRRAWRIPSPIARATRRPAPLNAHLATRPVVGAVPRSDPPSARRARPSAGSVRPSFPEQARVCARPPGDTIDGSAQRRTAKNLGLWARVFSLASSICEFVLAHPSRSRVVRIH